MTSPAVLPSGCPESPSVGARPVSSSTVGGRGAVKPTCGGKVKTHGGAHDRCRQRDGLVTRKAFPTIPPRVDYELTALGLSLVEPVRALAAWAEQNKTTIQSARQVYDTNNEQDSTLVKVTVRQQRILWQCNWRDACWAMKIPVWVIRIWRA